MQYDCVVGDDVAMQEVKHEKCRGGCRELGAAKGYLSYCGSVIAVIIDFAGVVKPISWFHFGEVVLRLVRAPGVDLLQPTVKPSVDVMVRGPIYR